MSVSSRRSLFVGLFCCGLAAIIYLLYVLTGVDAGQGVLLAPLDDAYIHFQYARQLAQGEAYVYNPGLPPTSGATSFLYPYLLAIGFLIGLDGLQIVYWAMFLGALALLWSLWTLEQFVRLLRLPLWVSLIALLTFVISGPIGWHYMSGMETGLVTALFLYVLYGVVRVLRDAGGMVALALSAVGLALMRPEGGIWAVIAIVVTLVFRWQQRGRTLQREDAWFLLPMMALLVQPLVNLLVTGSMVASGNASKSILGSVPLEWGTIAVRISNQLVRFGIEWTGGISLEFAQIYFPVMGLVIGVLMVGAWRGWSRVRWWTAAYVVLCVLAGGAALATLDTAFWHFKRYQVPLLVLYFPMSLVAAQYLSRRRWLLRGFLLLNGAAAIYTGYMFQQWYRINVEYVRAQPYAMAEWLRAHSASDDVVAVHDVGVMRYLGGRTTLDVVGLTTPGTASYWRNGPGAVAELLMREQPDIITMYGQGHGYGLGMIAATQIYGDAEAEFRVDLDGDANVALAAASQGIYRPDWTFLNQRAIVADSVVSAVGDLMDVVEVADVVDEEVHDYQWWNSGVVPGFPTEVHEFAYPGCVDSCMVVDGGRILNGGESFVVRPVSFESPLVLVSRVHPMQAGRVAVYANEQLVGTRVIPYMPGVWMDLPTLIPADFLTAETMIRIVPMDGVLYAPYRHSLWSAVEQDNLRPQTPLAAFQAGNIVLDRAEWNVDGNQLVLDVDWYSAGQASGDYVLFVHVYADMNEALVAQVDIRPGNGTLPPGNWLPGVRSDRITVDLGNLVPGGYTLAIGLYDPQTFERLVPENGDTQNRYMLGTVEITS
jgi:hypothetical protein